MTETAVYCRIISTTRLNEFLKEGGSVLRACPWKERIPVCLKGWDRSVCHLLCNSVYFQLKKQALCLFKHWSMVRWYCVCVSERQRERERESEGVSVCVGSIAALVVFIRNFLHTGSHPTLTLIRRHCWSRGLILHPLLTFTEAFVLIHAWFLSVPLS